MKFKKGAFTFISLGLAIFVVATGLFIYISTQDGNKNIATYIPKEEFNDNEGVDAEYFENQINDLQEKIATSAADLDELKESTESALLGKSYKDDKFRFSLKYPTTWSFDPWDYTENGQYISRIISVKLNGRFIGQLLITPNHSLSAAKAIWINGESKAQQVGTLLVDGKEASKLKANHVYHKESFIYLWEKDGTVYNFFLLPQAEKTVEKILTSFKYN